MLLSEIVARNCMSCNLPKCKSLTFAKKSQRPQFSPVCGIAEFPKLKILGMTFQSNRTFSYHLSENLKEANKCLFVLRSLRKEGCTQEEINCLFKTLVLPKVTYGLSVYAARESDLSTVQRFLNRCHKRRYCSMFMSVHELVEMSDKQIYQKLNSQLGHPMRFLLPKKKETNYNLRRPHSERPVVNTERYKNCFSNRLVYKYDLPAYI